MFVTLTTGAALADDSEPLVNQAKDALQAEHIQAATTIGESIQLTAGHAQAISTRLHVADYLSFLNGARLDDLGYGALDNTGSGEWHGSLTYSAGIERQSGSYDFAQGTRLELGYHSWINDTLEIGFTILGGVGNMPRHGLFGFTDDALTDSVELNDAWIKLSQD